MMDKKKIYRFFIHCCFVLLFSTPAFSQYFPVLPLPYPIEYLEKIPSSEKAEIEKEEEIEEEPATEFRPLIPADFKTQDAIGYVFGETFRVPPGLERQVEFWKLIYHHYSVQEYVIHDSKHMTIYRVVPIGDIEKQRISWRRKQRMIHKRLMTHKRQIQWLLRAVHKKQNKPASLTSEEKKIYDLFETVSEPRKFLRASNFARLRSQLGQKERFKQGIIWAGRYLEHMERIFREEKIPLELTRLPFVESSFNIRARSKVGASGIWQFIRSTGQRFLRINDAIDERNDPLEATHASARLLKLNYEALKSWPLAITAYNHGPAGMMRAVRKTDSTDLPVIIERYKGRTFGFASKNFYASFLAALDVELNYEKYFGSIQPEAAMRYDEVEMPSYMNIYRLVQYTNISKRLLKRYNLALTPLVFSGRKWIPKGYKLKLPQGTKSAFLAALNAIPPHFQYRQQKQRVYHTVRYGDTLYYLARRYQTTVAAIRQANQIGKIIYAGQTLVIPK